MSPAQVFSIANLMVLPMWLLMLFVPKWKVTRFLIDYKIIPIILSLIYAVYLIQGILETGMPDFGSLKSVMALFTDEKTVLTGWIHYLAFDLLIGMWMLDKNKDLKINQFLMIPCLLATFMFGPVGFILFMIIKTIKNSKS